ncbi:MAG TPA: hypothetical protein VFO38_00625 [Candidatus Saccharimonadales bacterium]|nr:hypothetical protein [Candidatus Saccharimonadales bacterium]
MKSEVNSTTQKKPDILRIVILVCLGILAAYLIRGAFFWIKGDGTAYLDGAKRHLAERTLTETAYKIDNKSRWGYHFQVEWIRPTQSNEVAKQCDNESPSSDDPANPRHYTIAIGTYRFYSWIPDTTVFYGCQVFKSKFDA